MSEPRKPGDPCQKAGISCQPPQNKSVVVPTIIYNTYHLPHPLSSYNTHTDTHIHIYIYIIALPVACNVYCRIIYRLVVLVYNNIIRPPGCLRDVHGSQLIPPPSRCRTRFSRNATIAAAPCVLCPLPPLHRSNKPSIPSRFSQ